MRTTGSTRRGGQCHGNDPGQGPGYCGFPPPLERSVPAVAKKRDAGPRSRRQPRVDRVAAGAPERARRRCRRRRAPGRSAPSRTPHRRLGEASGLRPRRRRRRRRTRARGSTVPRRTRSAPSADSQAESTTSRPRRIERGDFARLQPAIFAFVARRQEHGRTFGERGIGARMSRQMQHAEGCRAGCS